MASWSNPNGTSWGGGGRHKPPYKRTRKGHQQAAPGMESQFKGPGIPGLKDRTGSLPGLRVGPGPGPGRRVGPPPGVGRIPPPGRYVPPGVGPVRPAPNPQRFVQQQSKRSIAAFMRAHKGQGRFPGLGRRVAPPPRRP